MGGCSSEGLAATHFIVTGVVCDLEESCYLPLDIQFPACASEMMQDVPGLVWQACCTLQVDMLSATVIPRLLHWQVSYCLVPGETDQGVALSS